MADKEKGGDSEGQRYRLTVRLDASHLEQLREEQPQNLRIVGRLSDETLLTETVELDDGEGVGELEFADQPDVVGVFIGPARATAEELVRTQTITENVPGDRWAETREIELEPIRIPAYYWDWWYRWCREFVVRGRLVCPDGSPVPGAEVCAKDIDSWFYWSSTEQVGCDTTDENGAFEIEFRWCCGFWPWWWWRNRAWQPDERLIERIQTATSEQPDLSLAKGGHQPGLTVFDDLLNETPVSVDEPLQEIDSDRLERIRTDLTERLPEAPELRRLGVWPWAPWQPWYDCSPDLIFEATQAGNVVLEEDIGDARWDISTSENVSLTANEEALCRGDCAQPPCPGGECLLVTGVCGANIDEIGGNLGAQATPEGYAKAVPSVGSTQHNADRPFAGNVGLWRSPNPIQNIDYLEVEYDDGTGWDPVPRNGVNDFWITYYHPSSPSGDPFPEATFNFTDIDGHWVVKTREHYEETNPPVWSYEKSVHGSSIGPVDAFWVGPQHNLLVEIDSTAFQDGTYRFRLIGYEDVAGGDDVELERRGVVMRCPDRDEQQPVEVTLTFDNRTRVPVASHPHPTASLTPGSGTGTVHRPFVEPDTSISAVQIIKPDGTIIDVPEDEDDECPSVEETEGILRVDFIARDPIGPDNPTGHLSHYTLQATFGRSKSRNLLNKTSSDVTVRGSGSPHTGHKNGDPRGTYGRAVDQGATRPDWEGGEYRLEIDLDEAFPKPCCYQLELRARKRTIANCHHGYTHRNISEYSIGFGV